MDQDGSDRIRGEGNTRLGDSIKPVGLSMRCLAATGSGAQFLRVMIVRGVNERGTAPTLATMFTTTGSQAIMHSYRHVDYDSTYKIIYSKTIFFPSNTGDYQSRRAWTINLKLNSYHIVYNKGSTSPATAETGGLYLVLLSDANTGTNNPNFQYTARLRFIDN